MDIALRLKDGIRHIDDTLGVWTDDLAIFEDHGPEHGRMARAAVIDGTAIRCGHDAF